ncbi:MAG: DUF5103 domain-containing protein, partial [Flavobacteriales bacterium]
MDRYTLCLAMIFLGCIIHGQEVYHSRCYDSSISYLQCFPQSFPLQPPIIPLGGGILEFHFDVMSDQQESFQYVIRHCDRDWRPSNLMTSEYINGFAGDQIRDFDVSFNTVDDYVHYSFLFPNSNSSNRISGNYVAIIFRNDDPDILDNRIACIRFIVFEELVTVAPRVSQSSIIIDRFKKQEADCEVVFGNFKVYDPARDLKLAVLQNGIIHSPAMFLQPLFIRPERVSFDYNDGQNTFFAGNEWRHFDLKSLQYASDEISSIDRMEDGWHAIMRSDIPEGKRTYSSNRDINGNYLIQNDLADDSQLESEYVYVHFVLAMNEIPESDIIIELPWNICENAVTMKYSS